MLVVDERLKVAVSDLKKSFRAYVAFCGYTPELGMYGLKLLDVVVELVDESNPASEIVEIAYGVTRSLAQHFIDRLKMLVDAPQTTIEQQTQVNIEIGVLVRIVATTDTMNRFLARRSLIKELATSIETLKKITGNDYPDITVFA